MDDEKVEDVEAEEPATGVTEPEEAAAEVTEPEAPVAEASEPEAAEAAEEAESVASDEVAEAEIVKDEAPQPATESKGPSILKRILLWAAIVVAALFFLVGVAGVIAVWAVNTPVTNTVLAILQPIDNTLQRLEVVSGEAAAALSEASMSLDNADQRVQELGQGLAETSLVREALNRILDVDMEEKVSKAGEGIRSIYDTVVAVEETINAINAVPFLSLEVPGSQEMANIRTGMEEMATSAEELRQENQRRREERAENLVAALTAPINRLSDRINEMQTRMSNSEARFSQAVERMDELQSKVPRWIDIVSIIASLLLAWLIFSQGAVIALCWQALKG